MSVVAHPGCVPTLVRLYLIFLSQWHNKLCYFISDITDYFSLAKTSNIAINLTTRRVVNPNM